MTDIDGDAVTILDLTPNTVTGTIPVGHQSVGIAFSPDNSKAYVCNMSDGSVSVINALTDTVIGSPILVGANPRSVVATGMRLLMYVIAVRIRSLSLMQEALLCSRLSP